MRQRPAGPHPLDRWVRDRLTPIAAGLGARVTMPNDGPPYHPFQRWAMRAEPVHASLIGLLIHPRFGLWHAYRAALLFERAIAVPERGEAASPCTSCADRPCLATCPVGAFTATGYDAPRCRGHARADEGRACRQGGCLARHACPVGRDHAWGPDQQAFHMASFLGAEAARKDPVARTGQTGT
jgi:ferredoxin